MSDSRPRRALGLLAVAALAFASSAASGRLVGEALRFIFRESRQAIDFTVSEVSRRLSFR